MTPAWKRLRADSRRDQDGDVLVVAHLAGPCGARDSCSITAAQPAYGADRLSAYAAGLAPASGQPEVDGANRAGWAASELRDLFVRLGCDVLGWGHVLTRLYALLVMEVHPRTVHVPGSLPIRWGSG